MLTGHEIKKQIDFGNIWISDFNESRLGPNSYNLRLAPELMRYNSFILDAKKDNQAESICIPDNGYTLHPGRLYLARTLEYTSTKKFIPMLEGRSSVGRLGLMIHVTAGFGDIGFSGNWTLELSCVQPVTIYPMMEICQIYFVPPMGRIEKWYSGKYQGSTGIVASRMYRDFEKED